jgi:hypothetical protein
MLIHIHIHVCTRVCPTEAFDSILSALEHPGGVDVCRKRFVVLNCQMGRGRTTTGVCVCVCIFCDIFVYNTISHYTTPNCTTPHYTTLHHTIPHHTTPHHTCTGITICSLWSMHRLGEVSSLQAHTVQDPFMYNATQVRVCVCV